MQDCASCAGQHAVWVRTSAYLEEPRAKTLGLTYSFLYILLRLCSEAICVFTTGRAPEPMVITLDNPSAALLTCAPGDSRDHNAGEHLHGTDITLVEGIRGRREYLKEA